MDTVTINALSSTSAAQPARQVVFIENNLHDWGLLSRQMATNAEVIVLDSAQDGLAQMASYLATRQPGSLDTIHVLSHGAAGQLNLGSITLTQDSLSQYRAELNAIDQALGEDGDLLLYGCDVGAGEAGETLVRQLAAITRADVAASSNLTGASALGGDWVLETHSGAVNSAALTLDEYMGTLALTVTNSFATGVGTPEDLAIDSQNNLYVVSIDDNTLYKYAASGGAITGGAVNTAFATITNATCVAIDTAGNLYLGTGSGIIMKYPASGGVPSNVGGVSFASGFNNISDIVVGSDGYLYAADSGASKVYKLPASGGPLTLASVLASATVNGAQQLYIDAANNLYATSPSDGKVIKFAASGGAISLASPSDFVTGLSDEPRSITSDGTNFYIGTGSFGGDGKVYKTGAGGGAVTPENTFTGAQVTELLWAGSNTLYGTFSDNMVRKLVVSASNNAPTNVTLSASSVAENTSTASALTIGTLTSTDPDSGNTFTYSIAGGTDQSSFQVSGANLQFKAGTTLDYETKSSYAVTVRTTDQGGLFYDKALTITLTDVNEAPTNIALSASSVAENTSTASALTIGALTSTDPDTGNTFTYSIVGGADQASFQVSGANLQFKAGTTLDYETKSSYAVTVRSTDQSGQTYDKPLTITLTNVNEAPTAANFTSAGLTAATALANATAGTLAAVDPDASDTHTFSLVAGDGTNDVDNGKFTITGNTLKVGGTALTAGTYKVVTRATDASGLTFDQAQTITVSTVNNTPTDLTLSASSVAENTSTASALTIGTLTSTDPDSGNTFTYSIAGGTDQASFQVSGANLQFKAGTTLDYETKSSYAVTVRTTDQGGLFYDKALTITLTDVNEAPTNIALSASSVAENTSTASALTIGALTSTDPDAGNTFTYSIVGGADQASFQVSGANLQFKAGTTLDYETKSSYAVTVRSTDQSGQTYDKPLTITLTNVNEAPTAANFTSAGLTAATALANATAGTLAAVDPDASDTHTFSLVAGDGTNDVDNGKFTITGNTLKVGGTALTAGTYKVVTRATDASGLTFDQAQTITVSTVNNTPTDLTLSASSVAENTSTASALTIGTLTSTDPDSGNTFTYSIAGGTDQASFQVSGANLQFKAGTTLDYETKSSYAVTVRTTDQGGLFYDKALTITLTDVNEAPTNIALSASSVAENTSTASALTIGALTSTDPDAGNTFTYSIVGGADQASFQVSGANLQFKAGTTLDYETKSSYAVTVRSTDQSGQTYDKPLTITLTNVNEAPTAANFTSAGLTAATALANATAGTLAAVDPDASDTHTFSLVAGDTINDADNSKFTIVGSALKVGATPLTAGTYKVVTRATDASGLTFDQAQTITVSTVNNTPTDLTLSASSVAENTSTASALTIGTLTSTDPDSGNTFTYSIAGGTDQASFQVSGANLQFKAGTTLDYETKSSYAVTVRTTDQGGLFYDKALTITLTDVNEAPTNIALSASSVAENTSTASALTIGALTSTDPDTGNTFTYSIVGGADQASFQVSGANLQFKAGTTLDYETKSSYAVTVRSTDQSGQTYDKPLTITLTNVNEAPTAANFTSAGLTAATALANATAGTLAAVDPDASDTHTFSLVAGDTINDADNSKFTIVGSALKVGATPLTAGTYKVVTRATDASGLTFDQAQTITVSTVNNTPTDLTLSASSVAENTSTASALTIGTLTSTDPDSGNTFTYSIAGGTDQASFQVSGANLQFKAGTTLDYETKSSYAVTVRTTDQGGLFYDKALTITLTDVNEAPTNIALSASSVAENTSTASALNIGNLTSTDPDTGNTFTYSVVGGADQASFQVTGAALQFKAGTTLDYETKNSYAVTVRSTDQGGLTFDKAFTVTLTDGNDKPVITVPASQNITIGAAAALSGISVADQDAGSNSISLALSVPAGTLTATSGGGVTVSGSGSGSLTLAGSQSAINTFLSGGGVSYATAAGASAGSTVTLSLVANDNGFSGGGAQTGNGSVTLNLAAAGGGGGGGGGSSSSGSLVDGVSVTTGTVTRSDGSSVPSKIIPVVTAGRQDQDGASANADIPLAGSNTTPAIKAEIPVGIGMSSEGGDSSKPDKTDLITAIKSRTVDKSADQNSMVDLGNFFLKTLPNSADLWVRTVVISADSSKDAAGSLVFRGQTSDSNTDTALVLDFSNLPKNSKVSTENINFAAVVGEVTITTGDGNQLLIADNKAQTLDLGAGNDTVYSGAGDDVLNNSKGNDKLFGQGGNDTFNAENGQNTLHGGADSDTAKFTGKRADYTVERHDGYVKVINNADTSKSTLVVNTETLQFADSSETLQARDELKVLAGSYLQVLGRQADVYGFDYFGDLQSKGYSLGGIAINMIKSDEAKSRGFVLTGDAVNDVEMLYKAILGRDSDAGGKAAWVQQMQSGSMTLEQVANAFMVSGEMQKQYLVQTGWDFLV